MEEGEIRAKLRNLQREWDSNEQRVRKAATDYEGLMAERESLSSTIADLKKELSEKRQHARQTCE